MLDRRVLCLSAANPMVMCRDVGRPSCSMSLQKQRRLFMSGRSLDGASTGNGQKGKRSKVGLADALCTADFEKMRREVDLLGELSMPARYACPCTDRDFYAYCMSCMRGHTCRGF